MKYLACGLVSLLLLAAGTQADTITQTFTTGQIVPGTPTETEFTVARFDTVGGTLVLTRVTVSMWLESWGGYFAVENITNPSAAVTGSMTHGINSWITGTRVPDGMDTTLFAGESKDFSLPNAGDRDRIDGPATYELRSQTGPNVANAAAGDFGLYEGTGTYAIKYFSSQGSSHTASGGVRGEFESASSEGKLQVEYEYVNTVPEPGTVLLLVLGFAVLLVKGGRRRRAC